MATVPARDDELIRLLYGEHGGPLLGYVQRLVDGDRHRAEDIVQETLLRAWRHPEAFDGNEGRARAWLFTVARNLVVDGHRARRARPTEVRDDALAVVPAPDELDRAMEAWQVADALHSIGTLHRQVIVEVFYRRRSVSEAATELGVPPGTVKSRTFYALRALRLALEERGVTTL